VSSVYSYTVHIVHALRAISRELDLLPILCRRVRARVRSMLAKPVAAAPHGAHARALPACTRARDFAAGPSAGRSFSSSVPRSPRLSDYAPQPSANGPPPLSLRVKRSLTQRDRIAGVKNGVRLPFGETEWGQRIARRRRIADRKSKVVERIAVQRQLDETRREEALVRGRGT